jgi:hypothetical protein
MSENGINNCNIYDCNCGKFCSYGSESRGQSDRAYYNSERRRNSTCIGAFADNKITITTA